MLKGTLGYRAQGYNRGQGAFHLMDEFTSFDLPHHLTLLMHTAHPPRRRTS